MHSLVVAGCCPRFLILKLSGTFVSAPPAACLLSALRARSAQAQWSGVSCLYRSKARKCSTCDLEGCVARTVAMERSDTAPLDRTLSLDSGIDGPEEDAVRLFGCPHGHITRVCRLVVC